jgi:hypothetical protein
VADARQGDGTLIHAAKVRGRRLPQGEPRPLDPRVRGSSPGRRTRSDQHLRVLVVCFWILRGAGLGPTWASVASSIRSQVICPDLTRVGLPAIHGRARSAGTFGYVVVFRAPVVGTRLVRSGGGRELAGVVWSADLPSRVRSTGQRCRRGRRGPADLADGSACPGGAGYESSGAQDEGGDLFGGFAGDVWEDG